MLTKAVSFLFAVVIGAGLSAFDREGQNLAVGLVSDSEASTMCGGACFGAQLQQVDCAGNDCNLWNKPTFNPNPNGNKKKNEACCTYPTCGTVEKLGTDKCTAG